MAPSNPLVTRRFSPLELIDLSNQGKRKISKSRKEQIFKPVIFNVFHPVGMAPQGPRPSLKVPVQAGNYVSGMVGWW